VPDTTAKINFTADNSAFDKNGVQFVINPYDEFGLTRAVWLKEKQGASITVLNVGTAETEPTLRKALAGMFFEARRFRNPFTTANI
jgi:electron transfer flavoprotein beta subunit